MPIQPHYLPIQWHVTIRLDRVESLRATIGQLKLPQIPKCSPWPNAYICIYIWPTCMNEVPITLSTTTKSEFLATWKDAKSLSLWLWFWPLPFFLSPWWPMLRHSAAWPKRVLRHVSHPSTAQTRLLRLLRAARLFPTPTCNACAFLRTPGCWISMELTPILPWRSPLSAIFPKPVARERWSFAIRLSFYALQ
jgi:hypothetical protein